MSISNNTLGISRSIILTDICNKRKQVIIYKKGRGTSTIHIEENIGTTWKLGENLKILLKDVFLPRGYPDSVSSDYLQYQIWDTCQAFCSSISGTLTMRAVMQGIGVGSEAATPLSAAVTWIFKDGIGIVGSILFAWLKGSKLDSDCKKWRLFADILNDVAMFIELYIPFAMDYSMHMLCLSTIFKALVGTAGSSTRAALITHQAINGNTADVSAKDGSQEIFVNLCAFIFGILILKHVTETEHVWTLMCTATLFHILFNYKAVKCLKINMFNSERFCLGLRVYLPTATVPTVEQVNARESVFLNYGLYDKAVCGYTITSGVCLKKVLKSKEITTRDLDTVAALFEDKNYLILTDSTTKKLNISFRESFTEIDVLKAYFHAFLIGIALTYLSKNNLCILSRSRKHSPIYRLKNILNERVSESDNNLLTDNKFEESLLRVYLICDDLIDKEFAAFSNACGKMGWNLQRHLMVIGDWRAEWRHVDEKKESLPRESSHRDRNDSHTAQQGRTQYIRPNAERVSQSHRRNHTVDFSPIVIA